MPRASFLPLWLYFNTSADYQRCVDGVRSHHTGPKNGQRRPHRASSASTTQKASMVSGLTNKSGTAAGDFNMDRATRRNSLVDPLAFLLAQVLAMPDTRLPQILAAKSAVLDDMSLKEPVDAAHVEEVRPEDCPDGGLRAWLVVLGVFCGLCATVGLINAWGTFQASYQEVELSHRSSSDIAWIGSAQNAMLYLPGLAVGRLFDRGHLTLPVFAASVVFVVCTFLTAECMEYWQFLLCQGFGIGLASGVIFDMGNMILAHWFKKRLGLALACIFGGASIGGCVFPVTVKALLQRTSFPWTMRIVGFLTLGLLVITNLTIARRLPGTQDLGPLINIAEFKKPAYSFYVASLVVNTLALFTVLTYLTVSAVGDNLGTNLSFDLLTIANATSTLGRIGSGLLADRYGPLNILVPATLMTAVVTYAWPFATNVPAFVVISVLIGISTGAILAIIVQPFAHMGPVEDVGMRIGMGLTLATAGVIAGPPISGAIVDSTGSFKNVGYYGGSVLLLSAALMVAARRYVVQVVRDPGALEDGGTSRFELLRKLARHWAI